MSDRKKSWFEMLQSGFGFDGSTKTGLVKRPNDLVRATDNGLVSVLVLLDFDPVDYSIPDWNMPLGLQGHSLNKLRVIFFSNLLSSLFLECS